MEIVGENHSPQDPQKIILSNGLLCKQDRVPWENDPEYFINMYGTKHSVLPIHTMRVNTSGCSKYRSVPSLPSDFLAKRKLISTQPSIPKIRNDMLMSFSLADILNVHCFAKVYCHWCQGTFKYFCLLNWSFPKEHVWTIYRHYFWPISISTT